VHIALCYPVYADTRAGFTQSALGMVIHTLSCRWEDGPPTLQAIQVRSSDLIGNRNNLVRQALAAKAHYILWMDADHTFPEDALIRLLKRRVDIVGTNYLRRGGPLPVAAVNGFPLMTLPQVAAAAPMQRVDHTGLGFCLMKTSIFEKLPDPPFQGPHDDTSFFAAARAAGLDVWLDHELSLEIGHIAETTRFFPR
jgi:hypothetical protein